jgi:hypothetical protein
MQTSKKRPITAVAVAQPLRKMKILNFSQKIDFK